jgi:hypothetical protein
MFLRLGWILCLDTEAKLKRSTPPNKPSFDDIYLDDLIFRRLNKTPRGAEVPSIPRKN